MTGCILWTGALNSGGYPITWHKGKTVYAHRLLMNAAKDQIVMHLCDTPNCVNKDHLKLATHAENSADMVDKNRQATGEKAGNSKLKEEQVLEIRALQTKLSSRKVAAKYNISKTNVLDIWNNKIWRCL